MTIIRIDLSLTLCMYVYAETKEHCHFTIKTHSIRTIVLPGKISNVLKECAISWHFLIMCALVHSTHICSKPENFCRYLQFVEIFRQKMDCNINQHKNKPPSLITNVFASYFVHLLKYVRTNIAMQTIITITINP